MSGTGAWLGFAVAAALLLAGCGGGAASTAGSNPPGRPAEVRAGGEEIPDAGSISGLVVDDSVQPIQGASVALLETPYSVLTNEGGEFRFTNLAPGSYRLAAARLGFDSTARTVEVRPKEDTPVTVTLVPLAIKEAWVLVRGPWQGYFECRLGTPVITGPCGAVSLPNDKASFAFQMENETESFVGEMRWRAASAATTPSLRISFSYSERTSTHWFCSATGPTPIRWQYDMEDGSCTAGGGNTQQLPSGQPSKPTTKLNLITYANTPFGGTSTTNPPVHLALQQRFDAVVSLFQNQLPEENYTFFTDQ